MTDYRLRLIGDESGPSQTPGSQDPDKKELEALDAYSNVVVHVAEQLRPAVVNLRAGQGRRQGSGSGILFTPDGFLLTNDHVVHGNDRVRVRLGDGQELSGRVVGNVRPLRRRKCVGGGVGRSQSASPENPAHAPTSSASSISLRGTAVCADLKRNGPSGISKPRPNRRERRP